MYLCGGIEDGTTVASCASFNLQTNSWSDTKSMAPMKKGSNHAGTLCKLSTMQPGAFADDVLSVVSSM